MDWIKVSDQLPEAPQTLIVMRRFGNGNALVTTFELDQYSQLEGSAWGEVTHWKPLPDPPATEGNG